MTADPRVAVVVITHQRRDEVLLALSRLLELPERPHVVVVDNGSTDGTAQAVAGRFPGEEERLALDLAAAGWDIAYVDAVTVHHHPSTRRHDPAARRAAIWRSRVLTAVMRLPLRDVARTGGAALRAGAPGRRGLWRALPDLPAALRRRRRLPAHVLADLRVLAR